MSDDAFDWEKDVLFGPSLYIYWCWATINCIQNKSFCLYHICVCTVYIYYVYIKTHTYSIHFENMFLYVYIYIYMYIIYVI